MILPDLATVAVDATAALRWDSLGVDPVAVDLGFFQIRWYSLGYLAIVMILGSRFINSPSLWYFLPDLLVPAGVLLLGAAAFALFRPAQVRAL